MAKEGDTDVGVLEKQVEDMLKQLDTVIKMTDPPESDDADATGSAKDNKGGMQRRPLKHTQQVKVSKKKGDGKDKEDDNDEDDMEKSDKSDDADVAKAKKGDDMEDDWSDEGSKTKKRSPENDETLTVSGQTISKSAVGDESFAIFKALNSQLAKSQKEIEKSQERIKKAEDEAELAKLMKRADDEFSFLPGTTEERAHMLKAIKDMPEAVQKSFETTLVTANKIAKSAFDTVGVNRTELEKSAKTFEAKVTEIAKRDNIPRSEAMQKARVEDPESFKAYQGN